MSLTLDNTGWELRHQIGPWKRSTLYRLGLAVEAAGAAQNEDQAHELVWNAIIAAGEHTSAREALELAGIGPDVVDRELRELEETYIRLQYDEREAQLRILSRHRHLQMCGE